jgi:hypothetical protein
MDDEGDVAEAGVAGPPLGRRDRRGRPVDAEHRAGRPDQPGGQEQHVAGAAADVEHPHARLHPGPPRIEVWADAIGCLPGLGEWTPVGDGLALPTRQTNRRRIAAEPGWKVSEWLPGRP